MKNIEQWAPTKFVQSGSQWIGSRDPKQLLAASRLTADSFVIRYVQAIQEFAHGRLLDHGAGQSPLFGVYRDLVSEVVAVDWQNSLHQTDYIDITCDLNDTMPFNDESFDTILSTDVVAHLDDPARLMRDFSRALKVGGSLILGTPFNYWLCEEPHDYFRWSRHAIARLGEKSNLRVARVWQCGGTAEVFTDVLLKGMPAKAQWAVPIIDRSLRALGLVRTDKDTMSSFTLGTVAVLVKEAGS